MTWSVSTTSDGHRNVSVLVRGALDGPCRDAVKLIDVKDMTPEPRGLKLTGAWWLIEEKAGVQLWWGKEAIPHQTLLLPLESRGAFKLDDGLSSPTDWDGTIYLAFHNAMTPRLFTLILDFDKL